jgi:integrase
LLSPRWPAPRLRVGEAIALDWCVNLATGTLTLGAAKTDAGAGREVDLPVGLVEALSEWRASRRVSAPVRSSPRHADEAPARQRPNIDFKRTIRDANKLLVKLKIEPISERVTPHSLRRTYASIRAAAGDHPVYLAEQLGHEDPGFTFRVYQCVAKRRDRLTGAYLKVFDRAP